MSVLVHKAVEPDNLTRKGKANLDAILSRGEYLVQPKLDGVYCQIVDGAAYSRTGEPLLSVPKTILDQFEGRSGRFIGELWLPETPHSVINGLARKQTPQPLELHLFDTVSTDGGVLYWFRHEALQAASWASGVSVVRNLPMPTLSLVGDAVMPYLYELAGKLKAKTSAYDGLILRDKYGAFVPGSGKDGGIIKIKPRQSGDFRVVGCTDGLGNRAGGIGAYVVDLGGGVTCEVGSGLTNAEVRGDCLKDKIIEVEYLSITKDGRLREPAFKSVRWDKQDADVLACNVPGSD
jgi:hypothetical protein